MGVGNWSQVRVAGHLCDIFEPTQRHAQGHALIYLHGVHLARLDENETYTRLFEDHGLCVCAPHTARSWWTNKICAEFDPSITAERHLLDNVLPYARERWQRSASGIGLLGTSMGAQGALRFAFKYPQFFPVVAALAPAIDYQQRYYDEDEETIPLMYPDPEAVRQDTATLHVHPLNWPRNMWFCSDPQDERWHESAQRLQMKLYSLGIPHDCDLQTSAGGHGWAYYNHMAPRAVGFLVERLERERLRVL